MKKLLFTSLILAAISFSASAATLVVNATTNGIYLLSTNRASVYVIEATGVYPGTITLYDCDDITAPAYGTNYTNAAYVGKTTYATNMASSYVGANGLTNWYTNAGIFTLQITNAAATNQLPVMGAFVVAGGTYAVYNTDMLFSRGVCARITTNLSVVVSYRSAQ